MSKRRFIFAFLFMITIIIAGCATIPTQKDEAFAFAVEAVQNQSYSDGSAAAWIFIDSADPEDPRYDRGLKLLAQSIEKLELTWAAGMIYREIAQTRRNVEVVPEAISGIKRIVSSGNYDEDILVTSFIASEEFSDLPGELMAFVNYHQGLDLVKRGADQWAQAKFAALPEDSEYAFKAEYVRAVKLIADGNYKEAVSKLDTLSAIKTLPANLKKDVQRTLARIAFEEERYSDALEHFTSLKELAPDDPEILIEMAWTYYYLGDSRKTLGLLVALDAPVHKKYISPERYLLEALALRRLCQFGAARLAVEKLETRYANSLTKLKAGLLPQQIDQMRDAAMFRGQSRSVSRLLEKLMTERQILAEWKETFGEALYAYLDDLYARGIETVKNKKEQYMYEDLKELTEELLAAKEGVRLIVHELGVSLLRGRRRPAGAVEKPAVDIPFTGDRVFYNFGGEFWTDEMDDLLIIAEDRCID